MRGYEEICRYSLLVQYLETPIIEVFLIKRSLTIEVGYPSWTRTSKHPLRVESHEVRASAIASKIRGASILDHYSWSSFEVICRTRSGPLLPHFHQSVGILLHDQEDLRAVLRSLSDPYVVLSLGPIHGLGTTALQKISGILHLRSDISGFCDSSQNASQKRRSTSQIARFSLHSCLSSRDSG